MSEFISMCKYLSILKTNAYFCILDTLDSLMLTLFILLL